MREYNLVKQAIANFELNLKGLRVTTEAASGNYRWTCIAALQAGAEHVYAVGRDSKYGIFQDVVDDIEYHLKRLGLSSNAITFSDKPTKGSFEHSQIITNSGFLRPLDAPKLKWLQKRAVIPLMFETWEYRAQELDLEYCFTHEHMVLGTNESHKYLQTMHFIGAVVRKLLNEMNIEACQSKLLIMGETHFVNHIKENLQQDCICDIANNKKDIINALDYYDAIVVADMISNKEYIGNNGVINIKEIQASNPNISIVHIAGLIDDEEIRKAHIKLLPKNISPPLYMSATTDYVGPKPAIDLTIAGLKVGECMARAVQELTDFKKARTKALTNELCQEFPAQILNPYFSFNG